LERDVKSVTGSLLLIALAAATAAHAADPDNGKVLAHRWCATCHVVAPDQRAASADVPSFATIARTPGFNEARLAFFLLEPHPKMPNLSLTRREAADIAAYIATLAK
jgi:mono/diheme cytochrome c family protein